MKVHRELPWEGDLDLITKFLPLFKLDLFSFWLKKQFKTCHKMPNALCCFRLVWSISAISLSYWNVRGTRLRTISYSYRLGDPPSSLFQFQKFLKFFGQGADSGRYILEVCLVKTESNDIRIQFFCFGKAICRYNVHRENLRDGYYFHQQSNNKRIKRKDQDFLWWLWK